MSISVLFLVLLNRVSSSRGEIARTFPSPIEYLLFNVDVTRFWYTLINYYWALSASESGTTDVKRF